MSKKLYTKEFLISELQRFYNENGRVPRLRDMMATNGYPSAHTYKIYFGSWNNALIAAGFEINKTYETRVGDETCIICGCTREQTSAWYTKGLQLGEVMCNSCYLDPNYKRRSLDKNSNTGKGSISEQVVKNVLNLEEKYDCNPIYGYNHPFDLYDPGRYDYINVKSAILGKTNRWHFNLNQKEIPNTYIMLGYNKNRKNIIHIWVTRGGYDLAFDEDKMEDRNFLDIPNTYGGLKKVKYCEVDVKPYNDMLHLMSEKRKDNNGDGCFLSSDDLC